MKKSTKLWILIAILLTLNLIFYLAVPGEITLKIVGNILPVLCSGIAIFYLYLAIKRFNDKDYSRTAWLMIMVGIICDFIAESIYGSMESIFKMDMNANYPSVADFFWCLGYIPTFIGLAMMFLGFKKSGLPLGNKKIHIVISALIITISIIVFYYVLLPMIKDQNTSLLQKFFYLYYPIGDIFVVIPAIILVYITSLFGSGKLSKPWKYLAFGFICFAAADLVFSYLSWQGKYATGNLIDVAWHTGYLLISLSGIYQVELIDSFLES